MPERKLIELLDNQNLTAAQNAEIAAGLAEANELGRVKEAVSFSGVAQPGPSVVAQIDARAAQANQLDVLGIQPEAAVELSQLLQNHPGIAAYLEQQRREAEAAAEAQRQAEAAAAAAEEERRRAYEAWLNTPFEMPWSPITFSGAPVGGYSNLILRRDGSVEFSGHFHVSGAPSYNVDIVYVVFAAGKAFSFSQQGHLAGTFESGSRDFDWDVRIANPEIAANWEAIRNSGGWRAKASVNWDIGALVDELVTVAGYVGQVIAVVA